MKLYAVTAQTTTIIAGNQYGPHPVPVFKEVGPDYQPAVYTSRKKAEALCNELRETFPDSDYNVLTFDS